MSAGSWRELSGLPEGPSVLQRLRRILTPASLAAIRRGTEPISDDWGFDRGTPVDRYYIERFLAQHRRDIRGRVLEIKDSTYANRYGTGVERCDVMDIDPANPNVTFLADLSAADQVSANLFDCLILTQTLQLIYDPRSAIDHAHRMLRPGGVLLVTVPSVSRIAVGPSFVDYWRFTSASCARLFGEYFGPEHLTVTSQGNVLVCIAFLLGLAYDELSPTELDVRDDNFPLLVTVRAVKHYRDHVSLDTVDHRDRAQ
jgi:SAM-dependent methyltransferase